MSAAGEGRQPELRHRVVAAAGASIASALLVNPLDVVKTRVQTASLVTDRPIPSCLLSRAPGRYPVRWARQPSLADCQSKLPSVPVSGCGGASAAHPTATASQLHRPLLGQLPMSSCACAMKVSDLGPGHLGPGERCVNAAPFRPVTATGVLRDIVRKEGLGALWRGVDTAILVSIPMVGVYMPLYDYLLQRAAPSLGPYAPIVAGSTARTLAVLLVGPLELVRTRQQGSADGARTAWGALKHTLRDTAVASASSGNNGGSAASGGHGGDGGCGAAGAASAGSRAGAAGTAAAGSAAAGSAAPAAAAAASSGGLGGGFRMLQSVPRLWTGVAATLARDVPFSAIYWGLVEQVRGGLLAYWRRQSLEEQQQIQQGIQEQSQTQAQAHALAGAQLQGQQLGARQETSQRATGVRRSDPHNVDDAVGGVGRCARGIDTAATAGKHSGQTIHQHHGHTDHEWRHPQLHQHQQAAGHPPVSPASSSPLSRIPQREQAAPPRVQTGQDVLAANLIAGSAAGVVAAAVTTPFDVVKTQLQVGDVRSGQTGADVLRRLLRTEGPAGLFKGWGPRAARTAPACAVVVASYEVLKLLL